MELKILPEIEKRLFPLRQEKLKALRLKKSLFDAYIFSKRSNEFEYVKNQS